MAVCTSAACHRGPHCGREPDHHDCRLDLRGAEAHVDPMTDDRRAGDDLAATSRHLQESLTAYDWNGARGAKWASQVAGMEATLAPVEAPLMRALRLDRPYRIADIGCGGGATTLDV